MTPSTDPVEPPTSPYAASLESAVLAADGSRSGRRRRDGDVVAVGGDLEPGTLLAAYRAGAFPMGLGGHGGPPLAWWSPQRRGVLPLDGLKVSRSLHRSVRRYETRIDTAFDAVVAGCADPSREGAWITADVAGAYSRLHRAGWAHSVETWADDVLVGGLYGVCVGGLFAGESMFARATDASKVALVALVALLAAPGPAGLPPPGARILDVQWRTDHLASLGAVEVDRRWYLRHLPTALAAPPPLWPGTAS